MQRAVFSLLLLAACQPTQAAEIDVRVGVVAYQDFDRGAAEFERLFDDLARSIERPVRFRLAIGTYGDVVYWLDKQLIDIALLTPGVFVETLKVGANAPPRCRYLASKLLPPADIVNGGVPASTGHYRDRYRAACLAAERSPL